MIFLTGVIGKSLAPKITSGINATVLILKKCSGFFIKLGRESKHERRNTHR